MAEPLPLSVWPVAQQHSRSQRQGRYLPDSTAHPAKMLPALARQAITAYTTPGDLVLDPMCGIGTSLVEAVHLDRQAIGVEYEPRWADLARANIEHATAQGAPGAAGVITGDARHLDRLLDPGLHGRVGLVLTSPPYGPCVHGVVTAQPGRGVAKRHARYSTDPANLAHVGEGRLLHAFEQILTAAVPFLRPGGVVVVTARPWRRDGMLVDFPAAVSQAAQAAGLVPFERNVALLAGLRGDQLVSRCSFFQLDYVRKARTAGIRLQVIAHEDVLVFRKPA
jgi:modification methylase